MGQKSTYEHLCGHKLSRSSLSMRMSLQGSAPFYKVHTHIPTARPAREAAPKQDMSKWAGLSIFSLIRSEVICMTKALLQTPPSALLEAGCELSYY